MRRFSIFTTFLFSVILSFSSACTRKQGGGDTLRLRLPSEPPAVDWTLATDNVSKDVIYPIQVGLTYTDFHHKAQPSIAESWTVSKDGKTYTFKLRTDAKWSDGQPVVAQHFVDSWERLLNPATAAEYAYLLFNIENAENYQSSKLKDFSKVGVKALDDHTFEVKLSAPAAYFIFLTSFWSTFPIRKDVIAKHGDKWTEAANIVSCGAYKLVTWEHDSKLVMEKNPHYFNKENSEKMPPKLEFRVVKENAVAVTLFDQGALDIVRDPPPIQMNVLLQRPELLKSSYFRGYYFAFNVKNPQMSDVRLRQALAMAVDRNEFLKVLPGMVEPMKGWIPEGMVGYNKDKGMAFDPVKAKALWDSVPKKPASLDYWYDQKEIHKSVAEFIQGQWKKHLGLEVKLVPQEWKVYLKTVRVQKLPIFRLGWGADYPDPDTFMALFTCSSGQNNTAFCNKRYDAAVKEAGQIFDEGKRQALYDEAQKILLEDETAVVPIFREHLLYLVSKRVSDFKPNGMNDYRIEDIRLK
jgi:oligopeptide transport system substrate-binding protein